MLARADERFLTRLAKIKGLPKDYVLGTIERDGGVRDGRIVSLSLVGFEETSLDVSDLDALERLEVVGKHQPDGTTKSPLASMVLGELPRLERLRLDGFPALAELDLSGCPALLELALPRSGFEAAPALPPKLEELSLDGNRALRACSLRSGTLRRLDVSRCGLEALDVASLPALTHLSCMFDRIRELDLARARALEALWCSGNGATITLPKGAPLRELAMSKNPRERFDASAYPALAKLFVDGAGLRSLTLANPALEHLSAGENALGALDVSGARALRVLRVSKNPLPALDVRALDGLRELEVDASADVACTELQRHTLPALRARFGLPAPTKTISKMDAFQLHAFVQRYDWDDGAKRLFEVVRSPACSLATALLVYWKSEPGDLARYTTARSAPRAEREWVELLREIEAGVANAKKPRWKANAIAFDARDVDGVDLSEDDPAIPAAMLAPVIGASMEAPRTPRRSGKAAKAKAKAKAKASTSKRSAPRGARRPRRAK